MQYFTVIDSSFWTSQVFAFNLKITRQFMFIFKKTIRAKDKILGFKQFINYYFGAELQNDLVQQLFLSFCNSPNSAENGSIFSISIKNIRLKNRGKAENFCV